ncbi:MAG: hypothetical protein M1821_002608 [Bathelium mastoideum]|nr:MAG: hypothetical protein M1821_002608 [Bathelium mastoideum]
MEPLSVTAGVLGITSFANLLLRTVAEIHAFYHSIKDAPQVSRDILIELEILRDTLQDTVLQETLNRTRQNIALQKSLMLCGIKINSLNDIIRELERGFDSKMKHQRIWAACKTSKKTEELNQLRASLEGTKLTLCLALFSMNQKDQMLAVHKTLTSTPAQGSSNVRIPLGQSPEPIQDGQFHAGKTDVALTNVDPRHRTIVTKVEAPENKATTGSLQHPSALGPVLDSAKVVSGPTTEGKSHVAAPPSLLKAQGSIMNQALQADGKSEISGRNIPKQRLRNTTIRHDESVHATIFGRFCSRTHISKTKVYVAENAVEHTETTFYYTYHPATWLVSLGFRCVMNLSLRAPRPLISPARAVPDDALIFELCVQGNVDAVRLLFMRGEASVSDVDSDGLTPLHVSTPTSNPKLIPTNFIKRIHVI